MPVLPVDLLLGRGGVVDGEVCAARVQDGDIWPVEAFKLAVWEGEANPRAAIALLEQPAPTATEVGISAPESKPEPRSYESPTPPEVPADGTSATPQVPARRAAPAAKTGPKAAPSREQARAILMALKDFEAVSNAELARIHGGSDRFWGGAKDRLRAELAEFTTEANTLRTEETS